MASVANSASLATKNQQLTENRSGRIVRIPPSPPCRISDLQVYFRIVGQHGLISTTYTQFNLAYFQWFTVSWVLVRTLTTVVSAMHIRCRPSLDMEAADFLSDRRRPGVSLRTGFREITTDANPSRRTSRRKGSTSGDADRGPQGTVSSSRRTHPTAGAIRHHRGSKSPSLIRPFPPDFGDASERQ